MVIEVRDRVGGDVEVVAGNHTMPTPTLEDCHWRGANRDHPSCLRLTLHSFDMAYTSGFIYFGVLGLRDERDAGGGRGGGGGGGRQAGADKRVSGPSVT